jgi:hypothetical protein
VERRVDGLSSGSRWCFIKMPVTEEEARGRPFDEGEMKGVGQRFGSAPSGCVRVAHSGAWRGGAPVEVAVARASEGGRRPPGGPEWAAQASWAGVRFSGRERKGGCSGLSWAKRPDGLVAMVGFVTKKNQEKEKLMGGLPKIPGRTDFGLR